MLMIEPGDMTGFQAVTQQIKGKKLDVLIHSPGGYPEAAEALVRILRRQFDDIRFIVPAFAKSAATMLAMSGNEILMAPTPNLVQLTRGCAQQAEPHQPSQFWSCFVKLRVK
jgi:ATP-dependent protease ClpP protease subunit